MAGDGAERPFPDCAWYHAWEAWDGATGRAVLVWGVAPRLASWLPGFGGGSGGVSGLSAVCIAGMAEDEGG